MISGHLRVIEGNRLAFWCPGCEELHGVTVGDGGIWKWNGSMDKPSFYPSVLIKCGHYITGYKTACWCVYNAEHPDDPAPFKCFQCHSFVVDGRIKFLGDCTHKLAGQTVDIPELPQEV